ncbi:unnamed protein product [Notodromas monacha]|uniref:Uncharacterized protein n=1 Tax=Notodromas monacha TaxID=399045 RepID=A0A7R9BVE0_9CRUS|nr:unnamed protein product [Notodromas monacha]CAG0921485.1 unnamed protein product [Notodromas monacha]
MPPVRQAISSSTLRRSSSQLTRTSPRFANNVIPGASDAAPIVGSSSFVIISAETTTTSSTVSSPPAAAVHPRVEQPSTIRSADVINNNTPSNNESTNEASPNEAVSNVLAVAIAVAKADAALRNESQKIVSKVFEEALKTFVDSLSYFVLLKTDAFDASETQQLKKLTNELNSIVFHSPEQLVLKWKTLRPSQESVLGVSFPTPGGLKKTAGGVLFRNAFDYDDKDVYDSEIDMYGMGKPLEKSHLEFIETCRETLKTCPVFQKFVVDPSYAERYFEGIWTYFRPIHEAPKDQLTPRERITLFFMHLKHVTNSDQYAGVPYKDCHSEEHYLDMISFMFKRYGNITKHREQIFTDLENLPPPDGSLEEARDYIAQVFLLVQRLTNLKSDTDAVHHRIWPVVKSSLLEGTGNIFHDTLQFTFPRVTCAERASWSENLERMYLWILGVLTEKASTDGKTTYLQKLRGVEKVQIIRRSPSPIHPSSDDDDGGHEVPRKRKASFSSGSPSCCVSDGYVVTRPSILKPCPFCNGRHYATQCQLSTDERIHVINTAGLCYNCLGNNHCIDNCHSRINCRKCGDRHHTALCRN